MKLKNNKSGFTLLEIIIVIIIVGVLASLALPRFFSTVEYSRATEALQTIASVRQSMERCYLMTRDYTSCDTFADLDMEDPQNSVGNHFTYTFTAATSEYTVIANRAALNGGDTNDDIAVEIAGGVVTRSGTGAFEGIQ